MKNAMKSKMAILVMITYANGYLNILKKKKNLFTIALISNVYMYFRYARRKIIFVN